MDDQGQRRGSTAARKKARLILEARVTDEDGGIMQAVIWQVPRSPDFPDGVKYRLAYIPAGHDRPAVLYDNHRMKGHHRHILGRQSPYRFRGVRQLRRDFEADIANAKARRVE